MKSRPIILQSPLTPVALATKLRDVLGDRDDKPKAGVTGQGSETDMMLFVYRRFLRNGFAAQLTATMKAHRGGTRIKGEIGQPPDAGCMLLFWVIFLPFVLLLAAGIGAAQGAPADFWGPLTTVALTTIAVGAALPRIVRWLSRGDEATILAFLADTVEARPV